MPALGSRCAGAELGFRGQISVLPRGSLLGQGKSREAEPLLLAGFNGMEEGSAKIPASGKRRLREAAERLVKLYEQTDRPDKASE